MGGCRPERLRESLDSGIPQWISEQPRLTHQGRNLRFVYVGRLVPFKGTDLTLRALARTQLPVTLDVIGDGPQRQPLKALTQDLGLQDRVRFLDWKPHAEVIQALGQYRAFVLPSLGEANGIVVQEAMMCGLPVICLEWGGPALLLTQETGVLIKPLSEEYVISELARAMDRLAEDGAWADRMSVAGRERALSEGFLWADLYDRWLAIYQEVLVQKGSA
jgi:glycosyltransferase involved in cell wall biosynthesis